jgi:hypothetical protein
MGERPLNGARELTTVRPDDAGVIFDDSGKPWPAQPARLVGRFGYGEHLDIVANAVRNLGFVHVAPIRDVLLVTFEPSVVSPLAAVAAFYEISAHAAKRLILAYPGSPGHPDRCEVFTNVIDGLRRLDDAANRARNANRPPWLQNPSTDRGLRQPYRSNLAKSLVPAAGGGAAADRPHVKSRAGDYSERLLRPLASISAADEWLGELLGFWGSARRGRRLPSTESLDSLELLNMARGRAHIVDAASSDPKGYRFRLWGAVNSYGGGYANRALGEMPAGLMRDEAIADYRQVVATGAPSYHLISLVEKTNAYSYARLLLPLAQDGRRTDRLIVLINERRLPELGPSQESTG